MNLNRLLTTICIEFSTLPHYNFPYFAQLEKNPSSLIQRQHNLLFLLPLGMRKGRAGADTVRGTSRGTRRQQQGLPSARQAQRGPCAGSGCPCETEQKAPTAARREQLLRPARYQPWDTAPPQAPPSPYGSGGREHQQPPGANEKDKAAEGPLAGPGRACAGVTHLSGGRCGGLHRGDIPLHLGLRAPHHGAAAAAAPGLPPDRAPSPPAFAGEESDGGSGGGRTLRKFPRNRREPREPRTRRAAPTAAESLQGGACPAPRTRSWGAGSGVRSCCGQGRRAGVKLCNG